jgi:hypothetical protein
VSDKNFKVKSGLQVPSLTTAGPVVTDSSGNVTSSATLPISQGGTGQTTAGNALNAILPLQTSNDNKYLQTNGVDTQWNTVLQPVYADNAPSSPQVGQVWIESDSSSDSFDPNIIRRKTFTATAAQTVFTTDLEFIQGYEQVFFNGMLLIRNSDYTTASNTNVTLAAGAAAGDIVEVVSITNLNSINTVATTGANTITATTASTIPLTIQGAASQSAKLLDIKNSSGSSIASFASTGALTNTGLLLSSYGQVACQSTDTGISISGGTGYPNGGTIVFRGNNGGAGGTAANGLEFVAGGTERMRIDSSGNASINTTQALNRLNVGGNMATYFSPASYPNMRGIIEHSGQTAGLRIISQGVNLGQDVSGNISFWTTSAASANASTDATISERFRIDYTGNMSVLGGKIMHFYNPINSGSGSIYCPGGGSLTLASYNQPMINLYEDSEIKFLVGTGTQRAVINNAGELLIGYTSDNGNYKLQVNSQIFATSSSIATSDGRYKENVDTITSGLNIIDSLRPVSFTWKEHPKHNFVSGKTVGFIAQEVQESLSDYDWIDNIIKTNVSAPVLDEEGNEIYPEEEFLGIAEGNLIPLLVAAVKELKARVETLEAINV